MDKLQVAEFRESFRELRDPVEVIRYGRVVGTWCPAGTELTTMDTVAPLAPQQVAELTAEIKHLKAELAKRPATEVEVKTFAPAARAGYNNAKFTPVPKKEK